MYIHTCIIDHIYLNCIVTSVPERRPTKKMKRFHWNPIAPAAVRKILPAYMYMCMYGYDDYCVFDRYIIILYLFTCRCVSNCCSWSCAYK